MHLFNISHLKYIYVNKSQSKYIHIFMQHQQVKICLWKHKSVKEYLCTRAISAI